MHNKNQESEYIGGVRMEQNPDAQIRSLRAQMAQLKEQLEQQNAPQQKLYSYNQVQILLCCETINHILSEFDLSLPKSSRLNMARDYLYVLGDMREFVKIPVQQQTESEEEQYDLSEEDNRDQEDPMEKYEDNAEKTMADEIVDINRKMGELKKNEEKAAAERGKSGIEKIKDFIKKKTDKEEDVSPGSHEDLPESLG